MAKVPWSVSVDACCCEACDFIFQSLTASLPHHGYPVFNTQTFCGTQYPIDEGVRYLKQQHQGLGSSGVYCGGFPRHAEHTKTYIIDPFTGYECNTSEPGIEFWCTTAFGGAKNVDCSPTSLKWDCGTVKASSVCKEGADLPLNLTETLSNSYTLEDVANNVSQLLSQNPITETNIPPGAAGHVRVGSSHSVINWGGPAATCSYFYKEFGLVMKTRLRVKFPTADKKYKLVTRDKNYGFVSETPEQTTTKGQVIFVEPPSSPGYVCVEPACSFGFGAGISCTVSGSHTTRRRVCRDDKGEEITCPPCTLHIGPDCNYYNTMTTVSSGNSSEDYQSTRNYGCTGDSVQEQDTINGNVSSTTVDTRCPTTYSCGGELEGIGETENYNEETGEWEYGTGPIGGNYNKTGTYFRSVSGDIAIPFSYSCSENYDDCSGIPSKPTTCLLYTFRYPMTCGVASCNSSYNNSVKVPAGPIDWSDGSQPYGESTVTTTFKSSVQLQNRSVTSTQTSSYLDDWSWSIPYDSEKDCEKGSWNTNSSGTVSKNDTCTTTVTWSNSEDIDASGIFGPAEAGKWETQTLPWCSENQIKNCMTFTGCVERYKLPSYSTESSASYSCKITFQARQVPPGKPPAMYSVWYNFYDSEETIGNTGFQAASCPVRTVTAYNQELGTTSSGGQVTVSVSVPGLSTTEGKTKCRLGMNAWVYEIVPEDP